MRWWLAAALALASALTVSYSQAIVPHPGANPRLLATGPVHRALALRELDITLDDVTVAEPGDGTQGRATVPAEARLVTARFTQVLVRAPGPGDISCRVRLVGADGRSWAPVTEGGGGGRPSDDASECGGTGARPLPPGRPAPFTVSFLVPRSAADTFTLECQSLRQDPVAVRFRV